MAEYLTKNRSNDISV